MQVFYDTGNSNCTDVHIFLLFQHSCFLASVGSLLYNSVYNHHETPDKGNDQVCFENSLCVCLCVIVL